MARPLEQKLYRELKDSGLSFIDRGIRSTEEIYETVRKRFPHLCDDEHFCDHYGERTSHQPEWKHITRSVLNGLKSTNGPVKYTGNRGFWLFN